MENVWSFLLEILRLAVPAAAVGFAVYYVLRQQYAGQMAVRQLELQQSRQSATLPLRLQAYERLALFCERIAIPGLILRHRVDDQPAGLFRLTLMLAIQQEYEHNISQQVYVSEQLWQIVKAARDDSSQLIDVVAGKLDAQAKSQDLARALFTVLEQRQSDPIAIAQGAVRREAASLF
jgi:hypothetical protein